MIVYKNNYVEDERLFSTGNSELDEILEEVYYSGIEDGYNYAQKEFGKKKAKKEDKAGTAAGVGVLGLVGSHAYLGKKHSDKEAKSLANRQIDENIFRLRRERDAIHNDAALIKKDIKIDVLEKEAEGYKKGRRYGQAGWDQGILDRLEESTKNSLNEEYNERVKRVEGKEKEKIAELEEKATNKYNAIRKAEEKALKKNKKLFRNKMIIAAATAVPVGLAVRGVVKKKNSKKENSDQREFAKKEKKSESSELVKTGVGVAGTAGLGGAVLLGTSKIARSQADKYAEESKAAEKGAKEIRKRLDMMKNLSNEMGATLKGEEEAKKSIEHLIKKSEAKKKISEEFMKDSKAMKRLGRGSLGLAAVGAGVAATAGIRKIAKNKKEKNSKKENEK